MFVYNPFERFLKGLFTGTLGELSSLNLIRTGDDSGTDVSQ
ncbi:hypothetical protein [Haliea sp. E1-2-M8]|nr:hypothetical protein [Haliea sp. E1-2-M8]